MIEILSGTNRPGSNTLKMAKVILGLYEDLGQPAQILDLQDLPQEVFHPSSYATKPSSLKPITDRVLASAGIHVVTPEYNGSFPGVLKYFIDMLPFPASFEHRCVAFTGQAAGIWGAFRSVEQIQMIFGYRNAYVMPERVWIPQVNNVWAEDGVTIKDEAVLKRLREQAASFKEFVARSGHLAAKSA